MKTFRQLILFLGLTVLISGCGYTLAGKSTVIPCGQTVNVGLFKNRTYQPDIEGKLRQSVINELAAKGTNIVADSSDFVLSGEIVSLSNKSTAFSADDKAMFYTIVLEVQAELVDRRSGRIVWRGSEVTSQGYPSNSDLALQRNAHTAAVSAACETAARLLVIKMNQSF